MARRPDPVGIATKTWLSGRSERTQAAYRRALDQLSQYLAASRKTVGTATLADLTAWTDTLLSYASTTRRHRIAVIQSLYQHLAACEAIRADPARALRPGRTSYDRSRKYLSVEQVDAMMRATRQDRRRRALLAVLYCGGLRAAEICGARRHHLSRRPDGGAALTVQGKGAKWRTVVLPRRAVRDLDAYHAEAGIDRADDWIWPSSSDLDEPATPTTVYRVIRQIGEDAGIDRPCSPHMLRHAHISHALDNGAPIHLVAESVGHASLSTTSGYAHARPGDGSGRYLDTPSRRPTNAQTAQNARRPQKAGRQKAGRQKAGRQKTSAAGGRRA